MGIKRTFIKNTSLNLISFIYLSIASIISIPIIIHSLGVQAFGLYTVITSVTPILSAFDFGISLAVIRYLALPDIDEEEKTKAWQTSFYFFAILGLALVFIVMAIFYLYIFKIPLIDSIIGPRKLLIMLVVSFTMLVNHLNSHFLTLPQARHRFDIFSINAFVSGTFNTLLTAVVAIIKPDLLLIFTTQLIGVSITATVLYFYANTQFKKRNFPKFSLSVFLKLIGFGLRSFAGKVLSSIEANAMNFIIVAYASLQAVTYFSLSQSLVIKAAGGISMLTLSLFPLSTSLLTKEKFPQLKKLVIWLQVAVMLGTLAGLAIIFFFGKALLLLWLDDPSLVNQVYPLLQILSVQLFFTAMTPMPTAVLESMNRPGTTSFFAFLTVLMDLLFLFVFLPRFGITGAAHALSLSAMISVPLFFIVFLKHFRDYEAKLTA